MATKTDYYELLGVARGASEADIKKAYRKKAMELHPDRNRDDPRAETHFKEVNEAYDVLKDGQKKAAYDRFGHAAFENGGGGGFRPGAGGNAVFASAFSDVFDDLFGDFMGGQRARGGQRASRGSDLRYNLRMSLEEAYGGKQATISVPGSVACDVCNGSGAEGGAEPSTCPTCSVSPVRSRSWPTSTARACVISSPPRTVPSWPSWVWPVCGSRTGCASRSRCTWGSSPWARWPSRWPWASD